MQVSPYQYRLITKQGDTRWIMETVMPIMFRGKRAILGNSMDITEQKETKESLQEFDALKASILDAIPQAVVGLHNRQINCPNTAVKEVFGWQPEELIGKSVTVFYRDEKEAEEIARHFYTTLEHQRTFASEFRCRRKRWARYSLPNAVFSCWGNTSGASDSCYLRGYNRTEAR